ncbi:tRNA-specific adenosine deaminase [Planctomycetales bacterium]|nr:tRNA-specific adenosine deaminase [Planctomycetales bacterium]
MHESFMQRALQEAQKAAAENEVPVGAVIINSGGTIIAAEHNRREQLQDPSAHAEMLAIRAAAATLGSWRLEDCTLYVTLEPCPMCAGVILQARVPTLVFGANDPKAGAVSSLFELLNDERLNHRCRVIGGVLQEPCGNILTQFFQKQRKLGKK